MDTTLLDHKARSRFSRQTSGGTLVVIDGPDLGKTFEVRERPLVMGSGDNADLRLSDQMISRRHIRATPNSGTLDLRDLDSTNGCFLHEARFAEVTIGYGTQFRIGETTIKYVPVQEALLANASERSRYGALLGSSKEMRQMFEVIDQVANEDVTTLIVGETGTGKELVAKEIHDHSARKSGPFVVFDCAAIPRELIESSLFGHVRGSFTGATGDRIGAFEQADGGTIFLDEIGELQIDLQPALLRVLESRTITPVGSNQQRKVDVRIVAATHRQLDEQVREGSFREDLYYRLAVVCLTVPSLRERLDDVPLLATAFAQSFSRGRPFKLEESALSAFQKHDWPGNVRELRNAIERLAVFSGKVDPIPPRTQIPPALPGNAKPKMPMDVPYKEAKRVVVEEFEKNFISELLQRNKNNLSAAAKEADMDRKHLRELAKKYNLVD